MKAVPKVNIDGLYLEDALVDDAFTGVVPFYALLPEPEPTELDDELPEQPEEVNVEPEITGYIVGVPVPPGLFRPRFDLAAWETYQDAVTEAGEAYQTAFAEWGALLEEERGEPPIYAAPDQPEVWLEGLTLEEIEELRRTQPQEPDELERLRAENTELKLTLTELAEAQENDKVEMQLALAELAEIVTGGETVG